MENAFLSVREGRERIKNQPKHFTPEERVAAEDQIVDFVRCWPEESEIGVRRFIGRRRRVSNIRLVVSRPVDAVISRSWAWVAEVQFRFDNWRGYVMGA
jgi:hypothetical protein